MSDILPPGSPPPGWYESDGGLRWWDGAQWTGHRAPLTYGGSPEVPAAGYGTVAVALVNFLLGWTFIGWVVALVMACTSHRVVVGP